MLAVLIISFLMLGLGMWGFWLDLPNANTWKRKRVVAVTLIPFAFFMAGFTLASILLNGGN